MPHSQDLSAVSAPAEHGIRPMTPHLVELAQARSHDLDEAKLRAPVIRPGSVPRTALVNRLRASSSYPVMTVLAPAGYGKTTLLAQWADRDPRPFAWLSSDDSDDSRALLRGVLAVLIRIEAIDSVVDARSSRGRSTPWAIQRLSAALLSAPQPLVLVLDDVHRLRSSECAGVVRRPSSSTSRPDRRSSSRAARRRKLPLARLRSAGQLVELGADELALSRREARLLLRKEGVGHRARNVSELMDRTEGWAAGLYLAALSLQDAATPGEPVDSPGPTDSWPITSRPSTSRTCRPAEVRFLTRTAVLETMSGPSCDAAARKQWVGAQAATAREVESLRGSAGPLA